MKAALGWRGGFPPARPLLAPEPGRETGLSLPVGGLQWMTGCPEHQDLGLWRRHLEVQVFLGLARPDLPFSSQLPPSPTHSRTPTAMGLCTCSPLWGLSPSMASFSPSSELSSTAPPSGKPPTRSNPLTGTPVWQGLLPDGVSIWVALGGTAASCTPRVLTLLSPESGTREAPSKCLPSEGLNDGAREEGSSVRERGRIAEGLQKAGPNRQRARRGRPGRGQAGPLGSQCGVSPVPAHPPAEHRDSGKYWGHKVWGVREMAPHAPPSTPAH